MGVVDVGELARVGRLKGGVREGAADQKVRRNDRHLDYGAAKVEQARRRADARIDGGREELDGGVVVAEGQWALHLRAWLRGAEGHFELL